MTASPGACGRVGRPGCSSRGPPPFALINGAAVGLVPILLPIDVARYGVGHVGLVMGAFNLGAVAAPAVGALADRYRAHRTLAAA